jgi:hypothetical protein
MSTKSKKLMKKKANILPPRPPVRKLPPGFKGAKIEDIMAKAKEFWDPVDPELDRFLEMVRNRRRD